MAKKKNSPKNNGNIKRFVTEVETITVTPASQMSKEQRKKEIFDEAFNFVFQTSKENLVNAICNIIQRGIFKEYITPDQTKGIHAAKDYYLDVVDYLANLKRKVIDQSHCADLIFEITETFAEMIDAKEVSDATTYCLVNEIRSTHITPDKSREVHYFIQFMNKIYELTNFLEVRITETEIKDK